MKTLKVNCYDDVYEICFTNTLYVSNSNLAVMAVVVGTGETYCNVTINLNDRLDYNHAYLDVNCPKEIVNFLFEE